MQQIQRHFKTLFICLLFSVFSVSAQEAEGQESELMSGYAFKTLATSKKYKELHSQLPQTRLRPYRSDGNVYEELLEAIEDEVELMGLSSVEESKKINIPLVKTTLEGLFISGALKDETYFQMDLVNANYKEEFPDFFEYGGLFLVNQRESWKNAEISIFNRMLMATQTFEPKEKPAYSMIQIRLSDHAVFSLIDYSGSDRIEQLKEKVRGISFSELMSIVEHLKDIHAEKLKFVSYMHKKWNTDKLDGNWGDIAGMDYSYSATLDGNELKFGFACKTTSKALQDRDYYPYEIKYKKGSGEVKEEEVDGVTYVFYPKTNGQSMLFAYDSKSFVNLATEKSNELSAMVKYKVRDFFELSIECKGQKDFKEALEVMYKRLEADKPIIRDFERPMSFNATVEKLKSTEAYEKLAQFMGKIPKTTSIEPFVDSTDIKEDFAQLLEPIKGQLQTKTTVKNHLTTTDLAFNYTNTLPAQVLSTELKLTGKNSNAILTLTFTNVDYQLYFDYPLSAAAPFMLTQDGFLVQAFLDQKLSIDTIKEFPAALTQVRLLGGSNALVVFIDEHTSLTLMGLKEDYSSEELVGIAKELDQKKMMAIAEKYEDINASYWSVLRTFPLRIFEHEQTAVALNQELIKKELSLDQDGVHGFLAAYGHPFKLLEGGHYYFLVKCNDGSTSSFQDLLSGNGYDEVSEGKFTIYTYEQEYKGNANTSMQVIIHNDYPNKQIIHTVERTWDKNDLSNFFDQFFESEIDCEALK
jgi:hypothetical protein